jgi:hypothetical protein
MSDYFELFKTIGAILAYPTGIAFAYDRFFRDQPRMSLVTKDEQLFLVVSNDGARDVEVGISCKPDRILLTASTDLRVRPEIL